MWLSTFLTYHVAAPHSRPVRLLDCVCTVDQEPFPQLTDLILAGDPQARRLPWSAVTEIDQTKRRISVADLSAARSISAGDLAQQVLVKRDMLDALALDLDHQTAIISNDLFLDGDDRQLSVRAADTSVHAVLRRLTHGWVAANRSALVGWAAVAFLRGEPEAAQRTTADHSRIARLQPVQIARLAEHLPYLHAAELILLLPDPLAADVLEALSIPRQVQIIEELETHAVRLLALMAPDRAADLLAQLRPERATALLQQLPAAPQANVLRLLSYPAGSAGGIMTNAYVAVAQHLTIAAARVALRSALAQPDFIYYIYITASERDQTLTGVITVRALLVADEDAVLADLMQTDLITIDPHEPARTAARRVVDNALIALPVVTAERQLIGIVTTDAAVTEIAPRGWRVQAQRVFS